MPFELDRGPTGVLSGAYSDHRVEAFERAAGSEHLVASLTLDSMQDCLRASGQPAPPSPREVLSVWVEAGYRRQGIATALWDHAIELGLDPCPGRIQFPDGAAWSASLEERPAANGPDQAPERVRPSSGAATEAPREETWSMQERSYGLSHQAPTDDGYSAPLAAALTRFGPDILDDPHLYGRADPETTVQMRLAVEDPQAQVRIYRAVPPEHLEINPGDWVTLSRAYAHEHGYAADGAPDWPVVYADVPASAVFTDGNDPSEYGYNGEALRGLQPYREGAEMPAPAAPPMSVEQDVGSSSPPGFRPSPGATVERRIPPSNTISGRRVDR